MLHCFRSKFEPLRLDDRLVQRLPGPEYRLIAHFSLTDESVVASSRCPFQKSSSEREWRALPGDLDAGSADGPHG